MSEDLRLSPEQMRTQLAHAEAEARRLRMALGEDPGGGSRESHGANGGGGSAGLTTQVREEDEAASLFDRLSPAQLTNLYLTDRPRWQEIMAAKEAEGYRKLFPKKAP